MRTPIPAPLSSLLMAWLLISSVPPARADAPPVPTRDDPSALLWSTFLGGSAEELGWSVVTGSDGYAYVTGVTFSSSFPTTPGAYDRVYSGLGDVFVAKIAPDGASLVWSTFLGGSAMNFDYGYEIALGRDGAPVVTGYTWSEDFPTTEGAYDRTHNGTVDVFVSKLDPETGMLLWSTFLGGESHDIGYSVHMDSADNPVIAGRTLSVYFPVTPGVYDDSQNGEEDAFVTKLSSAGDEVLWSTYVGGSLYDGASAIEIDGSDSVIIAGATASEDYPGGSYAGGIYDGFVTKLAADGSALAWSRLVGGGGADFANDLALDEVADVFICGETGSPDFPVTGGAFDESYNEDDDAYAAKLANATGEILWATFLGGTDPVYETAFGIEVDGRGRPIVAGSTPSDDFPVTQDAYDASHNGASDVFVARLAADGAALEWGTFLGGDGDDYGWGIALDNAGNPIVAGVAGSESFPTTPGAFDTTYNGDISDVFVARLRAPLDPADVAGAGRDEAGAIAVLPHPVARGARLAFDLAERSSVTIEVLDAAGRLVASIAGGMRPAGRVTLDWDGRDAGGRPLPAGSYFLRLRAGSTQRVAPVIVVR